MKWRKRPVQKADLKTKEVWQEQRAKYCEPIFGSPLSLILFENRAEKSELTTHVFPMFDGSEIVSELATSYELLLLSADIDCSLENLS